MTIEIATIISVYAKDDPRLFERALSSIVNQNLNDDTVSKIYLGVDGSIGPELESVINIYRANIHFLIRNKVNEGLAGTLNRLINALEDEDFVFRMDSDDFSSPMRYQTQIQYMLDHPKVDILGTDIVEVGAKDSLRRVVRFCPSGQEASRYICYGVPVAHPSVCLRSDVFKELGGYPNTVGNEDIAFWFECLATGFRFDNIHVPLVEFTVNDAFWKRRSYAKAFSEFKCYFQGILKLHGLTWRLIFPTARLLLRLSPSFLVKKAYSVRAQKSSNIL